jgi:hypothetical protein
MILGICSAVLAHNFVTWNFYVESEGENAHWDSASAGQDSIDNGTSFHYEYKITSVKAYSQAYNWLNITDYIPADQKTGSGDIAGSLPIGLYNNNISESQTNSSATVTVGIDGNGVGLADFTNVHLGTYHGLSINGLQLRGEVKVTAYYNLTTNVIGGHGTLTPSGTQKELSGGQTLLFAKPDPEYLVKAWTGTFDDTSTSTDNLVIVDSDKTVSVEFEALPPVQYTLTTQLVNLHGSINPSGKHSFPEGTVVPLTVQADSGYRLKAWSGTDNNQSTLLNNSVTMTGNKTVTVEFEPLAPPPFSLTTVVAGGHGTIFPNGTLVYAGTTVVTLEAQADPGYGVKSWQGTDNDASVAMINKVTVDGIKTVTVEFAPLGSLANQLTTGVVGGNGTLWPLSGTFTSGITVDLIATPNTGFKVKKWSGTDNDTSTAQINKVTMSAAKSVTVEFEETAISAAPTENLINQNEPTPTPTTAPSVNPTPNVTCGGLGFSLMVTIIAAGVLLWTCKPE